MHMLLNQVIFIHIEVGIAETKHQSDWIIKDI